MMSLRSFGGGQVELAVASEIAYVKKRFWLQTILDFRCAFPSNTPAGTLTAEGLQFPRGELGTSPRVSAVVIEFYWVASYP
jgi:hypothetical protein